MTIFDTVAGFFGGQGAGDAQADALRSSLRATRDASETVRQDLAPQRGLGTSAANALQTVFFGNPASSGTVSGATPGFDFNALNAALGDFSGTRQQNEVARNALARSGRIEDLLGRDTSGFTAGQQRRFDGQLDRANDRLTSNLEFLGFDPSGFEFTGGTAATGPSLDPFFDSPEFQLFGDQNSRAVQDTFNALSAAGLADSGIGREAVLDTVNRGLGNTFNAFVNRNLGLSDRGQNASVQSGQFLGNFTNSANALNQNLGAVQGARQLNAFGSLGNLVNDGATAVAAGFAGPGGFSAGQFGTNALGLDAFGENVFA